LILLVLLLLPFQVFFNNFFVLFGVCVGGVDLERMVHGVQGVLVVAQTEMGVRGVVECLLLDRSV
jgi:hypothetical protein